MAVNYRTALKTTRMNAVKSDIDSGTAGTLEIGTSGFGAVLSTHTLTSPCGSVTNGVLTFDAIASATAGNSGTAAAARIKSSDGTVVIDGLTVGTSGTNVVMNSTTVVSGDSVSISSAAITHG